MSAVTNDGAVPYGVFAKSLPSSGGALLVFESFEPNQPTNIIERRNHLNEPSGQVIIADFKTATATVQLPSSSNGPALGAEFVRTVGGTAYTWIVSERGDTWQQGSDKKMSLTFRRKINV